MAFNFKDFIIGNLPYYFISQDTYKDNNGKGLLERYLGIFSSYIDEDIYPQINNYLNIIDASICEEKFLTHLSDVLGNPPDVFKNEEQYRNLLSYIVSIYKIKGTEDGYKLFFAILGFEVEIEEIIPNLNSNLYDGEDLYDNTSNYDIGQCQPCSLYNLKFYISSGEQMLDVSTVLLLQAAIDFNEPINATLGKLTYVLFLEDEMSISISDDYLLIGEEVELYDTGNIYDEEILLIRSSTTIKASTDLPSSITQI